jgi:hypothetical protein
MPASKKTSPKPNSLLEEARQSATEYQRKKGMQTWFQVLRPTSPKRPQSLRRFASTGTRAVSRETCSPAKRTFIDS